jgi:hypothetical protein
VASAYKYSVYLFVGICVRAGDAFRIGLRRRFPSEFVFVKVWCSDYGVVGLRFGLD